MPILRGVYAYAGFDEFALQDIVVVALREHTQQHIAGFGQFVVGGYASQ